MASKEYSGECGRLCSAINVTLTFNSSLVPGLQFRIVFGRFTQVHGLLEHAQGSRLFITDIVRVSNHSIQEHVLYVGLSANLSGEGKIMDTQTRAYLYSQERCL